MRLPVWCKILHEEIIPLKLRRDKVIERLSLMAGLCHTDGRESRPIALHCRKNGTFTFNGTLRDWMNNSNITHNQCKYQYRTYISYLCGEITEQNGKAAIKLYTVYNRFNHAVNWLEMAFTALSTLIYLGLCLLMITQLSPLSLAIMAIANIGAGVVDWNRSRREIEYREEILTAMRNEMNNRIDAVIRWEE